MEDVRFYAVDIKEEIKKERQRLQNIVINKGEVFPWMVDWLSKDDEFHYMNDQNLCNICGKKSQHYIELDFYCEEYPDSMLICKECLVNMFITLENKSKH